MLDRPKQIAVILSVLAMVWLAGLVAAWGQSSTGPKLEEVLSGFGEEESPPVKKKTEEVNQGPSRTGAPGGGLEEILEGFEEPPAQPGVTVPAEGGEAPDQEAGLPDWLRVKGSLSFRPALFLTQPAPPPGRPDHRGLAGLRLDSNLELEVRPASGWRFLISGSGFYDPAFEVKGRSGYPAGFLDEYELEARLDEAFLQGRIRPELGLKAGRQVVVWGKSDNIRVTDVLNPLDNRWPAMTDIEDLRLPVAMTKLDYYLGPWDLSAMMIHEVRFNQNPVLGSPFFPGQSPAPPEETPGFSLENQEYALSLDGVFSGWDLSLYGARVFDDSPHVALTPTGIRLRHSRLWMAGAAVNLVRGSWLLKAEAALSHGLEYLASSGQRKTRLDVLLGLEYSGLKETTISLELADRHLFGFDSALAGSPENPRQDELEAAVRVTREFMHDRLKLTLVGLLFDLLEGGGAAERIQVDYEWSGHITLSAGLVAFQSGTKTILRRIGANDLAFLKIKYSF